MLTPTRELANQIGESFATYGKFIGLNHTVIFGGVGQNAQEQALRRGVDVLVATPGRLLDLMNQGHVSYTQLEIFVLDEADRMLDMGFIHDVKRVIAKLREAPDAVLQRHHAGGDHRPGQQHPHQPRQDRGHPGGHHGGVVEQKLYFVDTNQKRNLLSHLMEEPAIKRAIVFTRTKHGANRVAEHLVDGGVVAEAIHGNKSQNARERALEAFKDGSCRVLVATDIAARGIDIDGVTHVINFDLPNIPESYVHRIGRTGRAGAAASRCPSATARSARTSRTSSAPSAAACRWWTTPTAPGDSAGPPRPAATAAAVASAVTRARAATAAGATAPAVTQVAAAVAAAAPQRRRRRRWRAAVVAPAAAARARGGQRGPGGGACRRPAAPLRVVPVGNGPLSPWERRGEGSGSCPFPPLLSAALAPLRPLGQERSAP